MSNLPIRVLIADGHPIVLEGLRSVLRNAPSVQIVGEAVDGMEALEQSLQLAPDIVLMELKLPKLDGLTVLRNLQTRGSRSKVIIFTGSENREELVEAMKLGCSGVLLKNAPNLLIEKSLRKVYDGEIWLDSNTTAAVIRQFATPAHDPPFANGSNSEKVTRERAQLSQREREIIVLIAQGYKNKEIAEKMFITEQTVKNHLHNIFDKVGVSDRLELALYAIHNSLHLKA
ncbi:MAG TPA: response regulator transcription factor [Bryobacteraceae bacterium]|nr:response regulator transcription factor [Bryobacteraceae bacterium]